MLCGIPGEIIFIQKVKKKCILEVETEFWLSPANTFPFQNMKKVQKT